MKILPKGEIYHNPHRICTIMKGVIIVQCSDSLFIDEGYLSLSLFPWKGKRNLKCTIIYMKFKIKYTHFSLFIFYLFFEGNMIR